MICKTQARPCTGLLQFGVFFAGYLQHSFTLSKEYGGILCRRSASKILTQVSVDAVEGCMCQE